MKWWFIVGVWLVFVPINICIASWNDAVRRRRIKNKNPRQIEHFWYGLGYCLLCGIPFYISRNWMELVSILLLHANVFACAYNVFSDNPFFHLSATTNSLTDKTYRLLKLKSIEEPAIITFCISVILLTVQLILK